MHASRPRSSRRAPRPPVVALLALALAAAGCGQHRGIHRPTGALPRAVESWEGVASGHGSYLRGGVERVERERRNRRETRRPVSLAPGEVFRGRRPVRIRMAKPGERVSFAQWAALLLPRLGAPVCAHNLVAVVAWQAQEATRAAWNPLATTLPMPGATTFNSHGVRNYLSLEQGLDATVLTLRRGWSRFGYGPIVERLRSCAHPMETAAAIRASWWCRDCAAGGYTMRLVPALIDSFNRAFAGV